MENKIDLQVLANVRFASPEKSRFYLSNEYFLCMELDGETFKNVKLHRALPFSQPNEYISIQDNDSKEIALIRDVSLFPEEQRELLKKELDKRYFAPTVTAIPSVKDKMGYLYFDIETNSGKKSFALADVTRNLRKIYDTDRIIIIDVDGNRYYIEDYKKLPPADYKRIEPYLF